MLYWQQPTKVFSNLPTEDRAGSVPMKRGMLCRTFWLIRQIFPYNMPVYTDMAYLKSVNRGNSWVSCNNGIGEGGRFSLAISPQSPNRIYACVEAVGYETGVAALQTHIYISSDYGQNWAKYVSPNNFLGSQGWFNNVITVHPFNENLVYVGGVDLGQIELLSGTSVSDPMVRRVDTAGTGIIYGICELRRPLPGRRHVNR